MKRNRITRSLATPARCSRGRVQERVQGDTAYRRRFPLHPLCKLRRGEVPLRTPFIRRSCRQLTEYRNIYSDIPLIPLPAAEAAPAAVPCSGCGPRKPPRHRALHDPQRRAVDVPGGVGAATAHVPRLCAYRRSPCLTKPSFLLLGSHHVAPSTSCIFAPSLRVARAAKNLSLRESSSPPGFRFSPCVPSVRARRARRKAPDGARTY